MVCVVVAAGVAEFVMVVNAADIDGFEDIGNDNVVGLEIVVGIVVNVANQA